MAAWSRDRVRGWVARWWRGQGGAGAAAMALALTPAEGAFRIATAARRAAYDAGWLPAQRVTAPVLSVGNLSVGGTGKTPVTRWLVAELRRRGARPAVIHGGYGDDEPALHRAWHPDVPVLVGRDRVAAARAAVRRGATVIVLDDGFQHRRLARDVDLVLLAAEHWPASRRLLPCGPWREPASALRRAGVIAVTRRVASRADAERVAADAGRHNPTAHAAGLHIAPGGWRRPGEAAPAPGAGPAGAAVAVAAIARPDWFEANARAAGARIDTVIPFPDHHGYTDADVDRILRVAAGRPVVTTAKDAVKLGNLADAAEVWILEQRVAVEWGGAGLASVLDELLAWNDSRPTSS